MSMYRVYYFSNKETGRGYVGVTRRTLYERKSEHMLLAKETSQRKLVKAIKAFPEPESWEIKTLYETPIEPEAIQMENAFIGVLNTVENGYNSVGGEYFPWAGNIAMGLDAGECVPNAFQWTFHGEYPDVVMYKSGDSPYYFGYLSGRKWVEVPTDSKNEDEVWWIVDAHFNTFGEATPDIEPQIDTVSPLFALTQIQDVIQTVDFTTQDDVDHFFIILNGMKKAV